jgi:multidrug efflux system membrane fusion protein
MSESPLSASTTETSRPGRRWVGYLVLLLVFGALGAGAWYIFETTKPAETPQKGAGKKGGGADRVTPVVARPARLGEFNVYLNGLGTVTPLRTVTVRSRVDGQLMRVLFREGQLVKEGELLAEIDPRPYQVQLTQAEGQMARDQAQLANARIDLERYRTLLAQDSIAKQLLDTQEALVRQYEGAVKVDQGQVDSARLQLTYSRITAPTAGRLGLRQVDPGNIVRSGDANGIVVITQVHPISTVFTIPQDNLGAVLERMQSADRIPVEAWDRERKNRLGRGFLITVDNQIDTATGTVKLKAQFSNEEQKFFPNQFVNIRMLVETRQDVVLIPAAAVQRGAQGTIVYVVKEDNTVTVRPVKVSAAEGDNVAVESGLVAGEVVVIDGTDRLREGSRVQVSERRSGAGDGDGKGKGRGGRKKGDDAKAGGARGTDGKAAVKSDAGSDAKGDGKSATVPPDPAKAAPSAGDPKSDAAGNSGRTQGDGKGEGKGERRREGGDGTGERKGEWKNREGKGGDLKGREGGRPREARSPDA